MGETKLGNTARNKPCSTNASSVVSHKYLYQELARYLFAQKIIARSRGRLRSTMTCLLHALSSYFRDTTLSHLKMASSDREDKS